MEKNQIEEMANIERLLRVRKLDIEKQGFDVATIFYGRESEEASIARYLVEEGYRKASDVARELITEIADFMWQGESEKLNISFNNRFYNKQEFIAELKKKYESEGGE